MYALPYVYPQYGHLSNGKSFLATCRIDSDVAMRVRRLDVRLAFVVVGERNKDALERDDLFRSIGFLETNIE